MKGGAGALGNVKTLICVVSGFTVYRKCEAGSHGAFLWRIIVAVKTLAFYCVFHLLVFSFDWRGDVYKVSIRAAYKHVTLK